MFAHRIPVVQAALRKLQLLKLDSHSDRPLCRCLVRKTKVWLTVGSGEGWMSAMGTKYAFASEEAAVR